MIKHTLIFAALILQAAALRAAQIQFVTTGVGSGTIGASAFTNASFTITSLGDTTDRTSDPNPSVHVFSIPHSSSTIVINGFAPLQFTSATRTFVSNDLASVGYARGSGGLQDLYDGPSAAGLATWDMLSSIGPISGNGRLLQWLGTGPFSPIVTDGGTLVFNDNASVPATFSATVVPEPATLALLSLGAVCFFVLCR